MEQIRTQLMEQARVNGICAEGYAEMRGRDLRSLVSYYTENPDWCMERGYPSLDFLREHFADMGDMGVFVGRRFRGELLNERQAYIFHDCSGTVKVGLNVEKGIIPMMYVANGCRLRFVGVGARVPRKSDDKVRVPIYAFGANDVSAKDNKYAAFVRYNHKTI